MTASAMLEMPEETMTTERPKSSAEGARAVERVVLTGFMGSGKTTVGRLLAERLGWSFHDLDDEVERRSGRSVPEIFATEGEAAFRRMESAALAVLLGQPRTVVALGGGAPEVLGNRLLLEQTPRTAVVYLSAPLSTLLERCERQASEGGATERPLLGEAEGRFEARHPVYERMAKHRIATGELSPAEVADQVLAALRMQA